MNQIKWLWLHDDLHTQHTLVKSLSIIHAEKRSLKYVYI